MTSATRETRARRKIREAVEAKGAKITDLTWEPIGQMVEMSGRAGGWTVFAKWPDGTEEHALGYSWPDVVEWIDEQWASPPSQDHTAASDMPTEGL